MLTANQIKHMAYYDQGDDELDPVETMLYLMCESIYKMFSRGFYDEKTAREKIAKAINDFDTLKVLSDCFDKNLELQKRLESLKCEYNKTKSTDVAVKIAEIVTEP